MKKCLLLLLLLIITVSAFSVVITELGTPTHSRKLIALTFDACESVTPAYFDTKIVNFLVNNNLPATIFLSGRFAERNAEDIKLLSKYNFLEFENHSLSHNNHMDTMLATDVIKEIADNEKIIERLTGRKSKFFRFPAGVYKKDDLRIVNDLGLKVVHWSFQSGDPDKTFTVEKLEKWVLRLTKPGNILIFHINGRGVSTGDALPVIVDKLRSEGYEFVKLEDYIR